MKTATTRPFDLIQILLFIGAAGLLLSSIWVKNSIPVLIMEMIGLLLTGTVLFVQREPLPIPKVASLFIFYACLSFGLYLIPLPIDVWLQLPGRDFYQDIVKLLEQTGQAITQHSVSINPHATAQALLVILPSLGVFLATSIMRIERIYLLALLFISVAAYQGAWGLVQYSSMGESAHGSYFNRDHFVTLMAFALPLNIGLITHHLSTPHEQRSRHSVVLGFYIIALFVIFLGGIFSMSRAGIPTLFIGMVLTPLLLFWHTKKSHASFFILLFLITALTLAYTTGLIPVINRFIEADPLKDARWLMFAQQIEAIKLFFPLGTGPGTFMDVYTAFQPIETVGAGFVKHAHNDYLELLFETGVIGIGILALFFFIFLYGWVKIWKTDNNPLFKLQVGAGIGMLCSLIHAFFDFNFHTTAHPIIFSYMAGMFFTKLKNS